jgi:hypothetical protein
MDLDVVLLKLELRLFWLICEELVIIGAGPNVVEATMLAMFVPSPVADEDIT